MATYPDCESFHVLILGDFSGRTNRGLCDSKAALDVRPRQFDRDNLEELMRELDVRLDKTLVGDDQSVVIRFSEIDDFEPDELFEKVTMFSSLKSTRDRLFDPSTFATAAAEIAEWGNSSSAAVDSDQPKDSNEPDSIRHDVGALLDGMLADAQKTRGCVEVDFRRLIREIVGPVMPHRIDPRQDQMVVCVDQAIQTLMTALLHHPHFQQLEAAWRGLDHLVRRVETNSNLKLFLVDVSKDELIADLSGDGDIRESACHRLLVEQSRQTPGASPWSIVCGLHSFENREEDIHLLARIAQLSGAAQAPFIAAASNSLVGCQDVALTPDPDQWTPHNVESRWQELQDHPDATHLALLWPRILLRLPYGAATRPVDAFQFEEFTKDDRRENLLWGNPALVAIGAIAQSFATNGWGNHLWQQHEIRDLPGYRERAADNALLHACGEVVINERGANRLSERGITPVLSIQGEFAVRLAPLLSVAGTKLGRN